MRVRWDRVADEHDLEEFYSNHVGLLNQASTSGELNGYCCPNVNWRVNVSPA